MAAKTLLKMEQVGPKAWTFAQPPCAAQVAGNFDRGLDLMDEGDAEEAEQIFRAVIKVCPLHIDAYHHLALLMFRRDELAASLNLWGQAVEIGLQSLPEEFVIGEDRLEWIQMKNRPFLRAYFGLGIALFSAGRIESAHVVYNQLLSMNPNDNQGVRAMAMESGFALDRPDEVLRICEQYPEDVMADSLYGCALAFLQLGEDEKAKKALIKAIGLLPMVAQELLKKRHRAPKHLFTEFITVGGGEEAFEYWQRMGGYWKETEGALDYLAETLARYQPKTSVKKH